MRPAAGARIVESDRLHWTVAQSFGTAFGHDFDRHAAFKVGRVLLPILELGLFAGVQRRDEILILRLVERAVDVILAAFVPTGGHPGDVHVDAVAGDDGGDGVEERERVPAGFGGDGCWDAGAGPGTGGEDR